MKRLLLPLILIICFLAVPIPINAEVISTKEPTAKDTVYVAGNPDMYPLEYYNEKTERYEGLLPKIYEDISKQTGLDFSYIAADSKDRQKELADNLQVEIVSAYNKGEITPQKEIELFSYGKDKKSYTACIGFTKIINPEVSAAIEGAITSVDKDTWLSAAMELENQPNAFKAIFWLIVAVCILLLGIALLIIYIIRKQKKSDAKDKTKMTDQLTGIGNLNYFKDCYSNHISEEMRPLYYVAYVGIDIEKIETYFGTPESEELQRYAASAITESINDNDFAARIDNGIFALCYMCPDKERAIVTAEEIVNNLNKYNNTAVIDNNVLFRCGLFPLDKQNITQETAIYNARQGYLFAIDNKKDVFLCDKTVLDRVSLKSRLQKKISSAIENEEFHIYLQFIFNPKTNRFCGAEILSRWHDREEGVLSPANYIEDMKVAGMIDRLDFYIFDKTCRLLNDWNGTDYEKLYLSCNFTRTTLSSPEFLKKFEETLSKYKFNRSNLIIELTEDFLADNNNIAYKNIQIIKSLGCKVALDDFGSGYTSFSDLCSYPLDIIKIDRQIVTKALSSRGNAVLIGIIRMVHALGIEVLCEGVENAEENKRVIDADCDYIQGFLYSRVLPAENAMEFFNKKQ